MERKVNFQRLFAGNIKLDGEAIIGDPCYFNRKDDEINNVTTKVKPGWYEAFFYEVDYGKPRGSREMALEIIFKDMPEKEKDYLCFDEEIGGVPVDAGMVCAFDYGYIENNIRDANGEYSEEWYQKMCNITLRSCNGEEGYDCDTYEDRGVVTSSGFGDGYYPVFVAKDGEDIVGIRIIFQEDF